MNAAGPAKPTIKKFVYKARGIALRGSIRKPFYQELGEHAIVSTHAGAEGHQRAESENFSIPKSIQYKTASSEVTTEVIGQAPNRLFRTRVTSAVEGLDVLNGRITADRIESVLTSVFDERFYPKEPSSANFPLRQQVRESENRQKTAAGIAAAALQHGSG